MRLPRIVRQFTSTCTLQENSSELASLGPKKSRRSKLNRRSIFLANHSSVEGKARNPVIVPIVEGQSEVISVPPLIRRILRETINVWDIDAAKPFRVKRNLVVKKGEFERAIKQAIRARYTERHVVGGVLVLLDADDDCPRDLAETLLHRAKSETRLPVSVVLPQMELEAWILASKEQLR